MIETTERDGIAVLRLRHGPVNALNVELLTALPQTLAQVTEARGVVLTGTGRCFSTGVDLQRITDDVAKFLPALSTTALALFEHATWPVFVTFGTTDAHGCEFGCEL